MSGVGRSAFADQLPQERSLYGLSFRSVAESALTAA